MNTELHVLQVNSLRQELQMLASSRPVTIVTANGTGLDSDPSLASETGDELCFIHLFLNIYLWNKLIEMEMELIPSTMQNMKYANINVSPALSQISSLSVLYNIELDFPFQLNFMFSCNNEISENPWCNAHQNKFIDYSCNLHFSWRGSGVVMLSVLSHNVPEKLMCIDILVLLNLLPSLLYNAWYVHHWTVSDFSFLNGMLWQFRVLTFN